MIREASAEDFWSPIATIFGIQVILYIFSLILKDNGIVDIFWGLIVSKFSSAIFKSSITVILILNGNWHHRTIVTLALLWIWAIRMALYVLLKHNGEDWRFAEMRQKWKEAAHFIAIYSHEKDDLFVFEWIGWIITLAAIVLEFVSDIQILVFKKNEENKGKICTTGPWKLSRHPNFFFESLVWWCVYITACSIKWEYVTIWPLIITLTLRYVSGVPIIEKKFEERESFELYKKQTNCFIPWILKKVNQITQNQKDEL
ncbi:unnamed protein product [Moneuplotes crassus]|uniref:Steroid 5-alpha reductase C-terminal domain-containing protein n=1 Tax=Euplotes crassus TaxID=5936 RepID=A0AAD2D1H5_EUPCR|nr:unnamed protein product [Moneuplotes crassus]